MPRGDQPTTRAAALKFGWIYEDELPGMTSHEYDRWYKESLVIDSVRMGPPWRLFVASEAAKKAAQKIVDIAVRDRMQVPHRDTITLLIEEVAAAEREFFCHWLLRVYEAGHRDTSYEEGETLNSVLRKVNQVLGFAGYEPDSIKRAQLLERKFGWLLEP